MDSFFSLFDPSEGQNKQTTKKRHKPGLTEQDTVKKKTDPPKGRRRGRRSAGKNETLPEESSFLCEPNLSTEILVKDSSYFENYFEANKRDGGMYEDKLSSITEQKSDSEKKVDPEKKPRRRHSNRKTRRKRTKRSPSKDTVTPNKWNNLYQVQKRIDENVGKNVNDLSKKETNVSEDKDGNSAFSGYNVIDRLEKVSLKDDVYMAGDFNEADLDNDMFYSSDGFDDFANDSTSEPDDSGDEVYGCLPPEPRFGNVEYKLQLVSLCERRFQHLVTQLKWRLVSGGGRAVYVLGVRDCGALVGLRPRALRASLCALRRMAAVLPAALGRVTARRVAPGRAVAEVTVRRLADPKQSVELRVAVMGANEAGKSTLIGVLTQGELDNGRGSARLNMFRHLHEVKSGRTSSLSHEILGFDVQGNVVNYGCSELMTAERIGERSAKLVSFLDLAGHSKYQRTTLHGLTGYSPHYAMLVISATGGITGITEEHISVLTALELPFFAVVSKWELAPAALPALLRRLAAALAPAGKKPLLITDENMARNCVAPAQRIFDSIDKDSDQEDDGPQCDHIPVFPVSSVRGNGLNALHAYLLALQPRDLDVQRDLEEDTCEFQIDEIFHVGDSSAPVVGGLLTRGHIREGDQLIIGPMESGEFVPVTVGSVYRNRVACGGARAGHCASLGLRPGPRPRPGMVLLARPNDRPRPRHHCCLHGNIKDLQTLEKSKLNKDEKRKNKNLLVDMIQHNLSKEDDKLLKTPEDDCVCPDRVALEDPNNPRGCIYFQASVHVLRHATAIYPGFQCTVHVGNVRQTAIIEGIMSRNNLLRAGEEASVLFRFVRCPEYLVKGRRLLFTAGLGTRATGRVTQTFPHYP